MGATPKGRALRPPLSAGAACWSLLIPAALLVAGGVDRAGAEPPVASWYGYNSGYDWTGAVTAAGAPFNPWRIDRAATPLRADGSPVHPLGTRLLVCAADRPPSHGFMDAPVGCTVVEIDDTCPGCIRHGIALDLTAGAWRHIVGRLEWDVAAVEIWSVP